MKAGGWILAFLAQLLAEKGAYLPGSTVDRLAVLGIPGWVEVEVNAEMRSLSPSIGHLKLPFLFRAHSWRMLKIIPGFFPLPFKITAFLPLALVVAGMGLGSVSQGTASAFPDPDAGRFNLSREFRQRMDDRKRIDDYGQNHYQTEREELSQPVPPGVARPLVHADGIKVLGSHWPAAVMNYRTNFEDRFLPLRGFLAPILENAGERWPAKLETGELPPAAMDAARMIERDLAREGLLPTLVKVIERMGPEKFLKPGRAEILRLRAVGFPVDLLRYFQLPDQKFADESAWVVFVAERTASPVEKALLIRKLQKATFNFFQSKPGFRVSAENGPEAIALVRLQISGGYDKGGIIPGSSLEVAGRLVDALPEATAVVSLEERFAAFFQRFASQHWTLRRPAQILLTPEPLMVSAWSQDNGKPGVRSTAETNQFCLLTPRYASRSEIPSLYVPEESFVMDDLGAAGIVVSQSPLLFQGGNLWAIDDVSSRARTLLIGEAEIYRNVSLGLTKDQTLQAFKIEFGVDNCLIIPSASFHLDFDVSLRVENQAATAFVNEPAAAYRTIVGLGLDSFSKHGMLGADDVRLSREGIEEGNDPTNTIHVLEGLVARQRSPDGKLSMKLAGCFLVSPEDSPTANLQVFLTAFDFLCAAHLESCRETEAPARLAYLQALERTLETLRDQKQLFTSKGWQVISIPSLPDAFATINYINGKHTKTQFLLPTFGGFYEPLDRLAEKAFAADLPKGVAVVPILSSDSQRFHGAIHCMLSVFPVLERGPAGRRSHTASPAAGL